MMRDADPISLKYLLQYHAYQAQGRRLHVLIWATGVLILAVILGLTVGLVTYLNSDLANPTTVPLTLTGVGLSMAVIVAGISRIVEVVPKILTARNESPNVLLAVQEPETGHGDAGA